MKIKDFLSNEPYFKDIIQNKIELNEENKK